MPRSLRVVLSLLALAIFPLAHAQSCTVLMEHSGASHSNEIVSVATLRIPAKAWQHFEKARSASESNKAAIVEHEIAQALAIAPRFAEAYLLLGAQQVRNHQYEAALQTISTARTLEPNLQLASIVVAGALNQLGRFAEAAAELDRVDGEEAHIWQVSFEHARAALGLHDLQAALRWSTLAVAAAPVGCTDSRLLLANALQLAGQREDAIAELETYLRLDRQGTMRAQVNTVLAHIRNAGEEARQSSSRQPVPEPEVSLLAAK